MTASLVKGFYFELTLYMNLWNNEIISHPLSARCEDRMTYISGSRDLIELKKHFRLCRRCALRSGSHICIEGFTELLPMYKAVRSVSRAGTPTCNTAVEAIYGLIKTELFMVFHATGDFNVEQGELTITSSSTSIARHIR